MQKVVYCIYKKVIIFKTQKMANIDREKVARLVRFDDRKKGIVRSNSEMAVAVDDKIRRMTATRAILEGRCDYNDSRTEY